MPRVLLFTDEPMLALGFVSTLSSAGGFDADVCAGPAASIPQAASEFRPDVLLIDLTPDVTFGILAQLQRELPVCRIVLWVRSISTEVAYQAMDVGVRGVLRKTLPAESMVRCLTRIDAGELWFDRNLTASFLAAKTIALTKRESQLVKLLAHGLKNKEIASALSISEGTVKVYLSRLFQKVGVKDRFELALYGLRNLQNMGEEPAMLDALPALRTGRDSSDSLEQRFRALGLEGSPGAAGPGPASSMRRT